MRVIVKTVAIKAEAGNIIQHIGLMGAKGDFNTNMNALKTSSTWRRSDTEASPSTSRSISKQFHDSLDSMALHGDFGGWYAALDGYLMDEYPRGYALAAVTSPAYEALRHANDHPLFACEGMHAYYSNLA